MREDGKEYRQMEDLKEDRTSRKKKEGSRGSEARGCRLERSH